ncbi:MAG: hypothetical protein ABIK72_05045 [candidate division WOR-3 bacterium]
MANYKIICEDTYGKEFFKKLTEKLKKQNRISKSLSIDVTHLNSTKCNSKLTRVIKANIDEYDKIIIITDADGQDKNEILEKVKRHIPDEYENRIRVIILDYSIEDWIYVGLGDSFSKSKKPLEILKEKYNYEKFHLPKYVEEINIEDLQNFPSFRDFLNRLNCA